MSEGPARRGRPRRNPQQEPEPDVAWMQGMLQAMQDQAAATNNLVTHITQNQNQQNYQNPPVQPAYEDLNRNFFKFHKLNPPVFNSGTDPMAAQYWLETIEKIFTVVTCSEEEKVTFAAHVLKQESDHWWRGAKAYLIATGVPLTWDTFCKAFLDKYFPANMRKQKNREFVGFKQGGLSVSEYVAKF